MGDPEGGKSYIEMSSSGKKVKTIAGIFIAAVVIVASQWYPTYSFSEYAGFSLPSLSFAVKWSSDEDDFFAAFLTTPGSAEELISKSYRGKEWRNDTLKVKLTPTHRNVPFFDLNGYELIRPDSNRWFVERIRKLDPTGYLQRGCVVIAYPEKGLIYISASD